jgi:hypothetical protein
MHCDTLDETVVGVGATMRALERLEARIACDAQSDTIARTEPLELGHDALGEVRGALGVETIEQRLKDVELVLNGKVDEIGVDQNVIRRPELRVVREKHARQNRSGSHDLLFVLLLLLLTFGAIIVRIVICCAASFSLTSRRFGRITFLSRDNDATWLVEHSRFVSLKLTSFITTNIHSSIIRRNHSFHDGEFTHFSLSRTHRLLVER